MNFDQNTKENLDHTLMKSAFKIINTQLMPQFQIESTWRIESFIKMKEKSENSKLHIVWYINPVNQSTSSSNNSFNNIYANILSSYCFCKETQISDAYTQILTNEDDFIVQKFNTYKQLKQAANKNDPNISKEEIYEKLLKPFRHEKVKIWDQALGRFKISYICKYDECNKEFTKTWNLLDHVRMHEGIKPFVCKIWDKTFTQKGNLKKHGIIQHSTKSLKERKKFKCKLWNKRYTERYNLVVRLRILSSFNLIQKKYCQPKKYSWTKSLLLLL